MNVDWAVFLFGVIVFAIGTLAFLLGYAAAAIDQAEHEQGPLARLVVRICRALGLLEEPPHGMGGKGTGSSQ
jgi:hypothetical protein